MTKKKAQRNIIIYGICCALCFLNIRQMYAMFFLLAIVVVFNIRILIKLKNGDEDAPPLFYEDKLIDKVKGVSKKREAMRSHREIREKKKLYADAYKARMQQIEEDFPDDIYDYEEDGD